jgi:Hom_end-associated Hint
MCLDSTNGGCFIADTTVLMADGSSQSIQDIKVGDKLKAVDGTNTVLSLIRPTLGHQDIYAINGQEAFFTANHPFLTTDGWKSLDPATTKKEIPDLEVSLLKIGDILITEAGKVLVISISASSNSSSTQLYNFELDGDHTYFANGFAVHNKLAPVN